MYTTVHVIWLTRLTAAAANANLFIIYLVEFWPAVKSPIPRLLVLSVLLSVLTMVNYIGVRQGARQSDLFTAAKLVTLGCFIVGALALVVWNHRPLVTTWPTGPPARLLYPTLLLLFAYGGYETALMPGGEAKNPRRDYPFALFAACLATRSQFRWYDQR